MKKLVLQKRGKGWKKVQCPSKIDAIKRFATLPPKCYNAVQELSIHKQWYFFNLSQILGKMNALEYLDLSSNNSHPDIPKDIGKLKLLRNLLLSNDHFISFPKEICDISKLQSLFMQYNEISQIPKCIKKLTNLKWLILSNNEINELPSEIENLSQLDRIDIGNNQLKTLPAEVGKLPKLGFIGIANNPIEYLPRSLCDKLENGIVKTDIQFEPLCKKE